jgi:ubiquinone biosynthesis protein COQ4
MLKRYDLGRALRAMKALRKQPDDITQVFEIAAALPGHALLWSSLRLKLTAAGRRLLAERAALSAVLADRAALAAMPAGSLAAGYLAFMAEEQITPQGLVDADTGVERAGAPSDEEYVWQHVRDIHDLWHVVTGYHGDYLGEPALQAFTFAQTGIPGSGFLALMVFLGANGQLRRMLLEGFVNGLRAHWLLAPDWQRLLPLPLDEVRRRLRTRPTRPYEPLRDLTGLLA